ncbi:Sec-independent protein translocase protein TatB [Acinetobacter sp. YH12134]|uniref:Sec-independent protein translocase protein TatB n=1 Tax=Acinetobacter sp. YH12134 TaxID=2601118 RepID=UPI0015D17895|nr:Sec-independent protein translocase protein TatB [Acinetobacter sp. YH12134]
MLNIGMAELLFFGIIALLVLGPEKLPEAARFVGKWYGKIKRTISNVQNDIDRELRLSELREQMQQEMARIQELEQKMQSQMYELKQQKIFAEEQPNQTAATDNKNLPMRYTFIAPQPSLLLRPQHQPLNSAEAIPPTTSQFTDYKVAV